MSERHIAIPEYSTPDQARQLNELVQELSTDVPGSNDIDSLPGTFYINWLAPALPQEMLRNFGDLEPSIDPQHEVAINPFWLHEPQEMLPEESKTIIGIYALHSQCEDTGKRVHRHTFYHINKTAD